MNMSSNKHVQTPKLIWVEMEKETLMKELAESKNIVLALEQTMDDLQNRIASPIRMIVLLEDP